MPAGRLFLKWIAAVIAALIVIYIAWFTVFLVCFYYVSAKYEQISSGNTRAVIEERKGLLFSRQVDRSFLGGYQFVAPFQELIADPENQIVGYSLFGAFFAVIYDSEGSLLAIIDNGLDG
ncbi:MULTISPECIES: hypothetical protein [unclassified Roseovarius]|uniref:hypothetical protein n=1 Tax=unclassified Roseovarius TaxID=2614913 RepID=UPI00273E134F|nr:MULTISPECIES: hypothetical protein [unclassified Roseovarius]